MVAETRANGGGTPRRGSLQDPWFVRWGLIGAAVSVVGVLVVVPVIRVFYEALAHGAGTYVKSLLSDPDTRHAVRLTLTVAPVAVALNVVFGVAAAWAIARYEFPGRTLVTALIDLPFSVSPVVAGLIFVLLFGLQGYFGPWLREHGLKMIFATPGLILATAFVTFPFVARELIPVMKAVGSEEEIAALSLGAGGWQIFWRVTVPNVKWGLLYGVILCNARATSASSPATANGDRPHVLTAVAMSGVRAQFARFAMLHVGGRDVQGAHEIEECCEIWLSRSLGSATSRRGGCACSCSRRNPSPGGVSSGCLLPAFALHTAD